MGVTQVLRSHRPQEPGKLPKIWSIRLVTLSQILRAVPLGTPLEVLRSRLFSLARGWEHRWGLREVRQAFWLVLR